MNLEIVNWITSDYNGFKNNPFGWVFLLCTTHFASSGTIIDTCGVFLDYLSV